MICSRVGRMGRVGGVSRVGRVCGVSRVGRVCGVSRVERVCVYNDIIENNAIKLTLSKTIVEYTII